MSIGFYAGTFDPFTIGHLHIIKNSAKLFEKVVIGIGNNPKKKRKYSTELMQQAIAETLKLEKINNCEVVVYNNLTVDVALSHGAEYLIRGLRNGTDYDYEENLALVNEQLSGLQTIYLRAGKFGAISSSMVNELVDNNKDVSGYVTKPIMQIITK